MNDLHGSHGGFFGSEDQLPDFGAGTIGADYEAACGVYAVRKGGCYSRPVFAICNAGELVTILSNRAVSADLW
jgi:hypothetical protein